MPEAGVLVMAYGSPASPAEVETYYTHIRRGRPPSPEQLADLRRRYEAIGGVSPLLARTRAQVDALSAALGSRVQVALGMKHATPFVEEAVDELIRTGVRLAVALVLAPHDSNLSVGEYLERAEKAAAGRLELRAVRSWHLAEGYLVALANRVRDALATVPQGSPVVFTAHSLPVRILATGDPYPEQLRETAAAVAARCSLPDRGWSTAWQSAGRTPEPWLGPDILEVVRSTAAGGAPGLVVCPAGFLSDHLEVLYDLDVEAARLAAELGLPFARTASLNDDPAVIASLAEIVRERASSS